MTVPGERLTEDEMAAMKAAYCTGLTKYKISRVFRKSRSTVERLWSERGWEEAKTRVIERAEQRAETSAVKIVQNTLNALIRQRDKLVDEMDARITSGIQPENQLAALISVSREMTRLLGLDQPQFQVNVQINQRIVGALEEYERMSKEDRDKLRGEDE
jgi:hypothetical protein